MITMNIIGWILLISGTVIAFYVLLCIVRVILLFHARRCKYCDHIMSFQRDKEENGEIVYDFHCDHCGAWERVTKNELLGRNGKTDV